MRGSKILVITYHFAPQLHASVFRQLQFLRHFRDHGLNAVILTNAVSATAQNKTPHPPERYAEFPVFRVDATSSTKWKLPNRFKNFLSLRGFSREAQAFGDVDINWLQMAYHKAIELIAEYHCDTIYIVAPPFSILLLGYRLKRRTHCKLIIDLQKLLPTQENPVLATQRDLIEQRIWQSCDALVVTSWSTWTHYSQKMEKEKVFLVFNSYDTIFNFKTDSYLTNKVFTIFYMGTWDKQRSPDKLLNVLQRCPFPWRLLSIGSTNHILNEQALKYHVHEHVVCVPSLSKEELLPYLQQADLLFLTRELPPPPHLDPHIATKVFNYLATGKPIVAQIPLGDTYDFLQKYALQVDLIPPHDSEQLYESLSHYYQQWQAGHLSPQTNLEFLQQFDSKTTTRRLSAVFQMVKQQGQVE
ncbi:glycosyl transferase group 1 [Beggiatoa alba B18LD]|uniref:Glycosyl transferase group 1 n=1 Tax=Beggiatoa alba B18LD TaxID=395493 RepID=I3CK37_9GAMM|nr:glycosyl transferase group 1 [Beggiatoa alba]EIJ43980.1 glycosyl transferase group 1 [Beggiatoa alba B18LD]